MATHIASPLPGSGFEPRQAQQSSMLQESRDVPLRYRPSLTQEELKRKIQQFSSRIDRQIDAPGRNDIDLRESPKDRDDTYFGEDLSPPARHSAAAQILKTGKLSQNASERVQEPSLIVQESQPKSVAISRAEPPRQLVVRNVGIQKNCKEEVQAIGGVETLRQVINDIHAELYGNVPIRSEVSTKADCDSVLGFTVETLQLMYDEISRLRGGQMIE